MKEPAELPFDRIIRRLEVLEESLRLDTEEVIEQYETHRHHLGETLGDLPHRLRELHREFTTRSDDLRQQLEELEVQKKLARTDRQTECEERLQTIQRTLMSLRRSVQDLVHAEEQEGILPHRELAADFDKLADHISAIQLHGALHKEHGPKRIRQIRANLRREIAELIVSMHDAESHDLDLLIVIGKKIQKGSTFLWDCLKEFFQYLQTDEQREERKRVERRIID